MNTILKNNYSIKIIKTKKLILGESPLYLNKSLICFIDIKSNLIFFYNKEDKNLKKKKFDENIGFVEKYNQNKIFIGLRTKILIYDYSKKKILKSIWLNNIKKKNLRTNDGFYIDNKIWFGLMDEKKNKEGGIFFYNLKTNTYTKVFSNLNTPNGPVFKNKNLFYFNSTDERITFIVRKKKNSFDKKIFKKFNKKLPARPDGMSIDKSGNLWICFFGTNYIKIFSKNGKLIKKIFLPSKNITSCSFDKFYKNLLITSATHKMTSDEKKKINSGKVFEISFN